ncbi:hypothetical protein DSL72_003992 [Monilinia vaccinii-corymbosi]|uniref:Heterokaryon incompatibility domain-containing protein n=1 Tax=Monilinia vaccinii-corymbosi TaxID=61207 RepID=A0A8A3P6S6_9HELO|nr:hypothetical protein DSL72_003992 [Monilinia vaccinii-corymbosi]
MNTTEETSTTGLPECERLCRPCIGYGVAQLLDDLQDYVPQQPKKSTERKEKAIRRWKKATKRLWSSDSALQILLIDVDENKLVEVTTSTKCLALSCIRGTGEVFKTTTDQRVALAGNGSLNRAKLPRTVRDAMSFTRKMQHGYLWVAALCIEQNEDMGRGTVKNSSRARISSRIFNSQGVTIQVI